MGILVSAVVLYVFFWGIQNPFLIVVVVLCAYFWGIQNLVRPKKYWWEFVSWRYAKPKSVEPSDAGYRVQQLKGGIVLILATVGLIVWIRQPENEDRPSYGSSVVTAMTTTSQAGSPIATA